jgi:lysophospholipase L1-like esterase
MNKTLPSTSPSKYGFMNVVAINVIVVVSIILILELFARVGISLVKGESAWLRYGISSHPASSYGYLGGDYYREFPEGYLGFSPKMHRSVNWAGGGDVSINKYGFRGADFSVSKPENTFRVVALGESSTFGFHVGDGSSWPYLLNKKFDGKSINGKKVEVINLGLPWYTTQNQIKLLDFALGLSPDLVIFMGGANDHVYLGLKKLANSQSYARQFLSIIEDHSLFFYKSKLLLGRYLKGNAEPREFTIDKKYVDGDFLEKSITSTFIAPVEENLAKMANRIRLSGSRFLVVSQMRVPISKDFFEELRLKEKLSSNFENIEYRIKTSNYYTYQNYINDRLNKGDGLDVINTIQYVHYKFTSDLRTFCKKNGIEFVDFVEKTNGNFSNFVSDLHLTEEGNDIFANIIFRYISDSSLNSR